MSDAMPPVHPWTLAWYGTLPEAYRMLDKNQIVSRLTRWDALTADPKFSDGWGEWDVTAPIQNVDEIMVAITRSFQGEVGEPIYVQAWWADPPTEGTLLQVSKLASDTEPEQEITVAPTQGAEGQTELVFYPTGDGKFVIRILILVPAPEGNLLELRAINVGTRRISLGELPVGNEIPATTRPLLRFMDGVGRVGGDFREISDNLWDGTYTNPATVPESSLRWLAQMMGVPDRLRQQLPADKLRAYLTDIASNGRQGAGTRTAIADAAKTFLNGERMVEVVPHATIPHTLVILVKAAEVPGGDLDGIVTAVRAAGVIPAGHDLVAREANASWDAWTAAAGAAWSELEMVAPTWARADSLGINLEG